ncbi:hypothetical protein UT300012_22070 [Paraclostridium bifermentans]
MVLRGTLGYDSELIMNSVHFEMHKLEETSKYRMMFIVTNKPKVVGDKELFGSAMLTRDITLDASLGNDSLINTAMRRALDDLSTCVKEYEKVLELEDLTKSFSTVSEGSIGISYSVQ